LITSALPVPGSVSRRAGKKGSVAMPRASKAAPAKKASSSRARPSAARSSSARPAKSASTTRTAAKKAAPAHAAARRRPGEAGHAAKTTKATSTAKNDQSGCWPHDEDSRAGGAPPAAQNRHQEDGTVEARRSPLARARRRRQAPGPAGQVPGGAAGAAARGARGPTPVRRSRCEPRPSSWPRKWSRATSSSTRSRGRGRHDECRARARSRAQRPERAAVDEIDRALARSTSAPMAL